MRPIDREKYEAVIISYILALPDYIVHERSVVSESLQPHGL